MKVGEEIVRILEAFVLTGSYRAAGELAGCDHYTVREYVPLRDAGQVALERPQRARAIDAFIEKIAAWVELSNGKTRADKAHEKLVVMGFRGSDRSTRRAVAAAKSRYRQGRLRVFRPWLPEPGLWLQFDWGEGTDRRDLPSWLGVHLSAFVRRQGVPATVRVDNEKTAVVRGAGAWGVVHPVYRRFGQQLRFHVDACAPRAPEARGTVERRIRDARRGLDPYQLRWRDVNELHAFTDDVVQAGWDARVCPATGGSVRPASEVERRSLSALPEPLPNPFDVAVRRRVGIDATVRFEGRAYTVPSELVDRDVVLHGTRASTRPACTCAPSDNTPNKVRHRR